MDVYKRGPWVYYRKGDNKLDPLKIGKWMFFFKDEEFAEGMCSKAVDNDVVHLAKYTDANDGVACFYLEIDDYDGHRRVIDYFIENDLIQRTKAGRLYNICFKLDSQTRAGLYGDEFKSELKLEELVDLDTGKWLDDR